MKKLTGLTAAAVFALSLPAAATTFDTRASFLAAGGTYTNHPTLSDSFTVTNGPSASVVVTDTGFTDLFAGDEFIIISGDENFNLDVTFATSIFAFGLDIYEPTSTAGFNGCNVTPCVDSTFAIRFLAGTTLLDTISIAPQDNALDFIGYRSATAFDRIEVRETSGSNDNEMFGNFVTSSAALAPVPLPASGALLLAGVALLVRRRSC